MKDYNTVFIQQNLLNIHYVYHFMIQKSVGDIKLWNRKSLALRAYIKLEETRYNGKQQEKAASKIFVW